MNTMTNPDRNDILDDDADATVFDPETAEPWAPLGEPDEGGDTDGDQVQ